ncbi:MAG TPA: hypothetical protein VGL98_05945 [Gammaproteobacteria bacterium]
MTPTDPQQVLERLPLRQGPAWAAIRALQARLAAEPDDARTAAELAREYLTLVRQTGEPRLLAYAHRALARWSGEPDPPADIALQRALLAQSEHHFAEARAELERLVAREPGETEAWLALAAIDTVQGRYAEASSSCMRLVLTADPAVTAGCIAATKAMTREASTAYTLLAAHFERTRTDGSSVSSWLATLAAETAASLARDDDARAHFDAALAASGPTPDLYLLTAYADFLLRQARFGEVIALLEGAPPADTVLLRLALAERRAGRDAAEHVATLRYRLQLALDGRDVAHAREAAFLALYLLDDPERALALALANWAVQREAIDARLVIEAAAAAHDPAAAAPVTTWLEQSSSEQPDLARRRSCCNASF